MNSLKKKTTATLLIVIFILSTFAVAIPVGAASIIHVGPGEDYTTIQAALDGASTDDIIIVHAGTYPEDLVIDVTVELKPAADESVTIVGVATGWSPGMPANIDIKADGVELHGFRIESPVAASGLTSGGIVVWKANVEIHHNEFVSYATDTGDNVAIQTLHADWNGDVSGLSIHDNTFSGTPTIGYVGIYVNPDVDSSNYVTIQGNTLTGYLKQGIITERDRTDILGNTIITDQSNTIYGNGIGVYEWDSQPQSDVLVSGNLIKGSGAGLGFRRGIFTGMTSAQTQTSIHITENTVIGNDRGVLVRASPSGVLVDYNNLVDNNMNLENLVPGTLDAEYNWWGTLVEDEIQTKISGDVDYTPWLNAIFPDGQPMTDGSTTITAPVVYPVVSILLSDTSITFDPVTIGGWSQTKTVTVKHTGSVQIYEVITSELIYDPVGFYDRCLDWDDGPTTIEPAEVLSVDLTLTVLDTEVPGEYKGTLVFWAEAGSKYPQ